MRRLVAVNSAWLIADKVVRLGLGLVVWVWFARAYGPQTFGVWNFAIALTALFGVVASLGMDGVVTRELAQEDADRGGILGTAVALRLAAAAACTLAALLTVRKMRPDMPLATALVGCNALAFLLQSSQVIDYLFQARMRPAPAVLAVNAAFVLATALRIAVLLTGAGVFWLGGTLVAEALLAAGFLVVAYASQPEFRARWRFDARIARRLAAECWPLLLSGLAVMAYMRLDQVMLAAMVGDAEVGQFSAALRIAEVWYFIPMAIMTAVFPAMIKSRERGAEVYARQVQRLYDGMAWLGLLVAVTISLLGRWMIDLLYGPSYALSAHVLSIQAWCGVSVAMSFVHGKWLLAEGLQKYGLVYTVTGAAVNLGLNAILIPRFGAVGAAWATLCTQVGLLPMQLFFPKARANFWQMLRALNAPVRYLRARA
jgi:PST family polysaccharide transporter